MDLNEEKKLKIENNQEKKESVRRRKNDFPQSEGEGPESSLTWREGKDRNTSPMEFLVTGDKGTYNLGEVTGRGYYTQKKKLVRPWERKERGVFPGKRRENLNYTTTKGPAERT